MVCAELTCTNHAKPSLRSDADLKVKLMLYELYKYDESFDSSQTVK